MKLSVLLALLTFTSGVAFVIEDKELSNPCRLVFLVSEEGDEWGCELDPQDNDGIPGLILATQGMQLDQNQENDIVSGETLAFTSGVHVQDDVVVFPTNPQLSPPTGKLNTFPSPPAAVGEKKALIVRVSSLDAEPTASAKKLSDEAFGTDGDPFNLVTQFAACSYDKFTPQPFLGEINGNTITNGVYETTVDVDIELEMVSYREFQNIVLTQLANELGYDWINEAGIDFVMLFIPYTNFGAYAYLNSYLSVFSNRYSLLPTVHMHEIGHNIGLHHSNENGIEYGDKSGLMGATVNSDDTGAYCFNGAKSWFLGWYSDLHSSISLSDPETTWTGKLIGIDDYDNAGSETTILRIEDTRLKDYYVMFNHADGINNDTQEGRNQVLVTWQDSFGSRSHLVAKLSPNEEFTIEGEGDHDRDAVIKFNSIDVNNGVYTASVEVIVQDKCLLRAFMWNADDDLLVGRFRPALFCHGGWEFNVEVTLNCRDDIDHMEFVTTGPGIDERRSDFRAPYFAFGGTYGAVLGLDGEFGGIYDIDTTVVFQDGSTQQRTFSFQFFKLCDPRPESCVSAYLWNADDNVRVGKISTNGNSFFCTEDWEYNVEVDLDCRDDVEYMKFKTIEPESIITRRDSTAPYFAFRGDYDHIPGRNSAAGLYDLGVTVAFDHNQEYETSLNFELSDCEPKPENCLEAFLWDVDKNISLAKIPPSQAGVSICTGGLNYSIQVQFECRQDISYIKFASKSYNLKFRRTDYRVPYFAFGGSSNTQNGRALTSGFYDVDVTVVFDNNEEYQTNLAFEIAHCE